MASLQYPERVTFTDWTEGRRPSSLGTNSGARTVAFQKWRNVKEAFAPELVARAIESSPVAVERCIDPFGGSGTTGLACQFLGVHPTVAEVNPYLADLTEAKLTAYDSAEALCDSLDLVIDVANTLKSDNRSECFDAGPRTLVEPGHKGRWIFDKRVADRVITLRDAINAVSDMRYQRLFRVILGGILVQVSNVSVSGKGRRYRRNWTERGIEPAVVTELFADSALRAIEDIERFSFRAVTSYDMFRGDSREVLRHVEPSDLAVFSPPYANSSDYTDVYNLELWMLGYLSEASHNSKLRLSTLPSHVQVVRQYRDPPEGSPILDDVMADLCARKNDLWNRRIPDMVGAYFADLLCVLNHLTDAVVPGGSAWIVVGDSRYAGVHIPVARVLAELCETRGWDVLQQEAFRSMRTSAQQGGDLELLEELLVLRNARTES